MRKSPAVTDSKAAYAVEGFALRSLGQKLGISEELKKKFIQLGWPPSPPEPDLLLNHVASWNHLVIECKAQGFSLGSSNIAQARKLIAVSADAKIAVGAPVGASSSAVVVYAIPAEDCTEQQETLQELSEMLIEQGLKVAPSGTLGIDISDGALWAELVIPNLPCESDIARICKRVKVTDGDEKDARPLYLVPYDPTAADNQQPEEKEYCLKLLIQRVLSCVIKRIGQADVPDAVHIVANDVLQEATFEISDRWRARELNKLKQEINEQVGSVLNKGSLHGKVSVESGHVQVNLADSDDREAAINLLLKAQTKNMARQLAVDQLRIGD